MFDVFRRLQSSLAEFMIPAVDPVERELVLLSIVEVGADRCGTIAFPWPHRDLKCRVS